MYVLRNSEVTSGSSGYVETGFGVPNHDVSQNLAHAAYASAAHHPTHHSHVSTSASAPASFGPLFRELRHALGLTLPTAASFATTRIEVIVALENGDLAALPPWPETVRVVTQLTGLAQIDPRPVLGLIHQEMVRNRAAVAVAEAVEAPAVRSPVAPVMGAPLPTMVQAWSDGGPQQRSVAGETMSSRSGRVPPGPVVRDEAHDEDGESFAQRGKAAVGRAVQGLKSISGTGRIVALSAILIAAGGTIAQGSAIKASFATLQTPISRLLKGAENYLIWRSSPVKDGLRWINVDDPRSRKGDKLKVNRPSA